MKIPRREWEQLLKALLDGDLRGTDGARLRELLKAYPELQQEYLEQTQCYALLIWRSGGAGKLPKNEVRAPRKVSRFPRLSRAGWLRVAAAAAGICVLGAWRSGVWEAAKEHRRAAFRSASQWFWPGTQIQCLELTEPVFSAPAQATLLEGKSSRVHLLRMKSGAARVRLESGAVMSWTGAVTLEFVSSMHVRVHDGKVTASIEERAKGFVIETNRARLVDLGTRFGVEVSPAGHTNVVVMEGEVEIHAPSGNARDQGILANLVVDDGVQIEKSRQLSPIKFLSFGPGKDEWTALPSAPPSAVIADVSDNDADFTIQAAVQHPLGRHALGRQSMAGGSGLVVCHGRERVA
jgi:hypothetical protein